MMQANKVQLVIQNEELVEDPLPHFLGLSLPFCIQKFELLEAEATSHYIDGLLSSCGKYVKNVEYV